MTRARFFFLAAAGVLTFSACRDQETVSRVDELESRIGALQMDTRRAIDDARHDLRMFRGDVNTGEDAAKGKFVEMNAGLRDLATKLQSLDATLQELKTSFENLGKADESLAQRAATAEQGLAKLKIDLATMTDTVAELAAASKAAAESAVAAAEAKPPETIAPAPPVVTPEKKGQQCPRCGGMGKILNRRLSYDPCPDCGGDGRINDD